MRGTCSETRVVRVWAEARGRRARTSPRRNPGAGVPSGTGSSPSRRGEREGATCVATMRRANSADGIPQRGGDRFRVEYPGSDIVRSGVTLNAWGLSNLQS